MAAKTDSGKTGDQAATAALYVTSTRPSTAAATQGTYLDEDGKLSSAGAAASLKYAQAADLPSYPSQGGVKLSSASAAASLAAANQKTYVPWKPGEIPNANKAAFLAKDYQAPPLWQPEMSSAGSRAALLAARDGGNVNIWTPEETDAGYSAAGQAMRRTDLSPNVFRGVSKDERAKAHMAAIGAMSSSRRRAESSPAYPSTFASSPQAAGAAASQRVKSRGQDPTGFTDTSVDAARIHNVAQNNVNRQMYTANPPVNIEVEEKNRKDTLHASAVAMAQQMFKIQQAKIEEAKDKPQSMGHYSANFVHNRRPSSSESTDDTPSPPVYTNLQEQAQKLATERLAKLHDENQAYRNYYGATTSPPRKRLSIRPKPRRRASSDSDAARIDEEQSQKIRSEMSLFQDKLALVDWKKRQKDRDALMAAAQRNVTNRMSTMDDKVFADTGKASPAMVAEWEAAAQARAQADSDARMVNHGKVHIGKGQYLEQFEVEAIARGRLQPTLDDITEKAEAQRARDEELRLEEEEKKRQIESEKVRSAELKAEQKKQRDAEKAEEKAKRDLEKSQLAEEKRLQRDAERTRVALQREKEGEEKRIAREAAAKEAAENRLAKEAAVKDAADKDGKRKGGLFSRFSLGAGAAAGAGGAVVTASGAPVSDPIPETDPIATEGETTTEIIDAPRTDPNDGEVEDEFGERVDYEQQKRGILGYLHEPKTETAEAEPSSPLEKTEIAPETTLEEPSSSAVEVAETAPDERSSSAVQADKTVASGTTVPLVTTTGPGETQSSPLNEETPVSPTKSGVTGWLKGKFARRSSRSKKDEPGFIGGAALTGAGTTEEETKASPAAEATIPEEDSMKEVAMAGKNLTVDAPDAAVYSASEYSKYSKDVPTSMPQAEEPPLPAEEPKAEEQRRSLSISSMSSAGAVDTTKDQPSPIDVSAPTSPAQEPVSPPSPEVPTSPTSPPIKPRGRDRFAGFLSKGKGLGRRLSKTQKKAAVITDGPSQTKAEASTAPAVAEEPELSPEDREFSTRQDDNFKKAEASIHDLTLPKDESAPDVPKISRDDDTPEVTKTESKDDEEGQSPDFEEARDTFDPGEGLAPPPKLTNIISENGNRLGRKTSGSPIRDSRFSEDL